MFSLPTSEEAWREMEDERLAPRFGGYPNAMAEEAAWYHARRLPCPFDCAACGLESDRLDAEAAWEEEETARLKAGEVAPVLSAAEIGWSLSADGLPPF